MTMTLSYPRRTLSLCAYPYDSGLDVIQQGHRDSREVISLAETGAADPCRGGSDEGKKGFILSFPSDAQPAVAGQRSVP
ncbi:hypothetical protein [Streptomyces sp. NPDC056690]|uniref:hypothetical protein n=1 Tax=unclassified Streptomyces TaxID=2593676 RepID=UPI0036419122